MKESIKLFLNESLGQYELIDSLRQNSTRTSVYKLKSGKDNYYLKLFSRKERYGPEVYAYRVWNKAIVDHCPALVKTLDLAPDFGILITELPGQILRESQISKADEYKVYEEAGSLTRQVHDQMTGQYFGRPDAEGRPLEKAYDNAKLMICEEMHHVEEQMRQLGLLTYKESKLVNWFYKRVNEFSEEKPVPLAWDSTPGNWLVDQGQLSGMIDFENMRWGIRWDAFGFLYERYFLEDMKRMQAFFQGYGQEIVKDNYEKILSCLIKMALYDHVYGHSRKDDRIIRLSRNLLDWLSNEIRRV